MSNSQILAIILGVALLILLVRALIKGSIILKYLNEIINDTMKDKNGKWSRHSIIIATAWFIVLWSFVYDLKTNGFNETAWMFLGTIALGAPVTKAISKKLDPEVTGPGSETTIKQEKTANSNNTTIKEEPLG